MHMIKNIKYFLEEKMNHYKLDLWKEYTAQKDFKDILDYIQKGTLFKLEHEVFSVYFEQLLEQV